MMTGKLRRVQSVLKAAGEAQIGKVRLCGGLGGVKA